MMYEAAIFVVVVLGVIGLTLLFAWKDRASDGPSPLRRNERWKKERSPSLSFTVRKSAIIWFLAALVIGFLLGRSALLYFASF